jgi:hypothetical protein
MVEPSAKEGGSKTAKKAAMKPWGKICSLTPPYHHDARLP